MENDPRASGDSAQQTTSIDHPAGPGGLAFSLRCHPGAVRSENQDRVGSIEVPLGHLFLVFDGVGGRTGGSRAASIGLEEYSSFLSTVPAESDPGEALQQATTHVNQQLAEARQSGPPEMQEMASTVALVLLQDGQAFIGHIGDSRVYRVRAGAPELLTRDHSFVQRMVSEGLLTPEQAHDHPKSNILTRSLGQPDAQLEVATHTVQPGDLMLLCSDGLWGYTQPQALASIITTPDATPATIADTLLQAALTGGGGDNISLIILKTPTTAKQPNPSRFGRKSLFSLIAVTVLLASAAICVAIWGPPPW